MQTERQTADAEVRHFLTLEQKERRAASRASDSASRDRHVMAAERYADRAWSLNEQIDSPHWPSGLWK
ncbi:hypothetical protein [Sphingomonas sp. PR090111-T3T-6A]|uniref:hypothetical protein n=1 Tax=Sphingomonas sp. PR090111-T3T-6A TaxID=685778 RepID=UPI00036DC091|nr:hypothetical protein [Sphingomonas sp. PR090111-T3T-6A]